MTTPQPLDYILLVAGSRVISDKTYVFNVLDKLVRTRPITKLIHGGNVGADTLAGEWATTRGVPAEVILTDPKDRSRHAVVKRDCKMVDMAHGVVVMWNGISPDTQTTLNYARHKNKLVKTCIPPVT
jgi:hypothetical protein